MKHNPFCIIFFREPVDSVAKEYMKDKFIKERKAKYLATNICDEQFIDFRLI